MKRPLMIKIMMGGDEDECPKCGMPEEECECGEGEEDDDEEEYDY
jgi:hypothetical protein